MDTTEENQTTGGPVHYARAAETCKRFCIARSTLWVWARTRPGFPQPIKAGKKVTLFDLTAIDAFLRAQAKPRGESES